MPHRILPQTMGHIIDGGAIAAGIYLVSMSVNTNQYDNIAMLGGISALILSIGRTAQHLSQAYKNIKEANRK